MRNQPKLEYRPDDIDQAKFNREVKRSIDAFSGMLALTREKALGGHDFWLEWHMNLVLQLMGSEEVESGSLKIEYRELPKHLAGGVP